jgi:large subunit ribosomal protein L19
MEIDREFLRNDLPRFAVGDTVDVGVRIREFTEKGGKAGGLEEKERVQVFNGTVLRFQGGGHRETFTVRRIVAGEGVERTFPIHSPRIAQIEVKRRGRVRRAKLYYLRERVGKATKVEERIGPLATAKGREAAAAKGRENAES